MASTFTDELSLEKQATGENENTWGSKLNALIDQLDRRIAGGLQKSVAGGVDVTLSAAEYEEGWLEFTGTLTGNISVVFPAIECIWLVHNNTAGAFTLTCKVSGQTGVAVTQGEKALLYGNATDIVKFVATDDFIAPGGALANVVEDTTPQLGGQLDVNGQALGDGTAELLKFSEAGSAVNEFTVANAAAGNGPELRATGDDTDIDIELVPKGAGIVTVGGTPVMMTGKHTIFVPAAAMRPTVSNGCASLTDVETTAGRPDLQVLDFDATTDEHAQFQVAFPKSWNNGTVTFRAFWTTTNTGTNGVAWGLQAVACADSDTIDAAYGTPAVVTDDNQSAAEDLLVTGESAAVTIAGSPGDAEMAFFRVFRDVSDANDDMTEDARLVGLQLFYTTDAGTDA